MWFFLACTHPVEVPAVAESCEPSAFPSLLVGAWEVTDSGVRTREVWERAADGALDGRSVSRAGSETTFAESLRLEPRGNTWVYVAEPRGERPTEFTLQSSTATSAVFVNPGHDFPRRITYARDGAILTACIDDGAGGDQSCWRYSAIPADSIP